jgi:hypothetical protein
MEIAPNAGGGFDVLPQREHFDTLSDAEAYLRSMSMATAIQAYEELYQGTRDTARSLIRQVAELGDLLDANPQIAAAVAAAEAATIVAGGTLPKEAYTTAFALLARLRERLSEELVPGSGITVKQAVLRLG